MLHEILRELASRSSSSTPAQAGILRECAERAQELERGLDDDVREFHRTFGHPAPSAVMLPGEDVLAFRIALIQEECEELCYEIRMGNLAGIASEAVDLIYVVVGTLVVCGLPLMPFWRDVQRANMTKVTNPDGGKPIKPKGWRGPDPAQVLHDVKTVDLSEPELW